MRRGVTYDLGTPLIRGFGLVLLELLDLERLAADRVHEFLFVTSPLRITRAPAESLAVA